MRTTRFVGGAILIVGSGLDAEVAQAQQPMTTRTGLQRHDLSVCGYEAVQAI